MPLHTWLPDAMEGPTPVSALIHAATMVTAGVYLIARMHPLFEQAPAAADVGAIVGCATLLIAATIGLVVTDLKRVIAYSTMSQIGYMVMAVSSAAYTAGLFHLMTHAFFKALLFMAAGSLISAMAGNQNLDDMGGFRKAMPFTFGCFIIGGLSLSGFPPFSGFFSKDEILADVAARDDWHVVLAVLGFVGVVPDRDLHVPDDLPRVLGRAGRGGARARARPPLPRAGAHQPGDRRGRGHRRRLPRRRPPHRRAGGLDDGSRWAASRCWRSVGGAVQIPGVTDVLHNFLEPTFADSKFYEDLEPSTGLTIVGLLTGTRAGDRGHRARLPPVGAQDRGAGGRCARGSAARTASSSNKWYFDEAINFLVVRPFAWFGRFGRNTFERIVISGLFMGGTTAAVRAGSAAVRAVQSGYLRYYAALLLLGVTGARRSTSWWRGHEQT